MTPCQIRVLRAEPGLDKHDCGAKVLGDWGYEVIYTGIRQTPSMIAEAALQEDVDVIGLSILSGAHLELFPRVVDELKARGIDRGIDHVLLFCGGIVPEADTEALRQLGFRAILRPGTNAHDILDFAMDAVGRPDSGGRSTEES